MRQSFQLAMVTVALAALAQQPTEWRATLAPANEPGEAMVVSGRAVASDGHTPVAGAVVYAYQTDAKGLYSPTHDSRNPRLRGWMKTDAHGRYEFRTIRPGSYPGSRNPAHIHFEVTSPGGTRHVDEIWFEGDPFLTDEMKRSAARAGRFSPIRPLTKDKDGAWRVQYDIRLSAR